MTSELTETERALIRLAETRIWDRELREMLRRAVERRGIITSPYDSPGDLADLLAGQS